MVRESVIGAFILLATAGATAIEPLGVGLQVAASSSDYDAFMKLSSQNRRARFNAMSAEARATIVRTHVRRWMDRNAGRLSAGELAAFEEIVAFLTPELSGHATSAPNKREDAVAARIRCRVAPEDVRHATNVFGEPAESPGRTMKWTSLTQAQCWVDRMIEAAVDYLPNIGL